MRRIDDLTDLANETLVRPDGLDDDFCHWVHCYFLERDMLPDEEDFQILINALVRELLSTTQGRSFLARTLDPLHPMED